MVDLCQGHFQFPDDASRVRFRGGVCIYDSLSWTAGHEGRDQVLVDAVSGVQGFLFVQDREAAV
jgi:hypothetical protein